MAKFKNFLILSFSAIVVLGTVASVFYALRSDLYTVRTVEVESSVEPPPLSSQTILKMAAVPTGRVSLFRLDLVAIEKRLLASEWIHHVNVRLKPSDTLSIFVAYREPRALIQSKSGGLALIDGSGRVYGSANLVSAPDLPIIGGVTEQSADRIQQVLKLLSSWEASSAAAGFTISTVDWDDERGFRALVSYVMGHSKSNAAQVKPQLGRTMVDFGNDISSNLDVRLAQLANVFHYLSEQGVAVRQVWADAGKKIVVKTARGS